MGKAKEVEVENTEVEGTEGAEAPELEVVEVAEAPKMKKKVNGVTQEAAITILVTSNPKRAGSASYDRFEGYLTDPAPATVKDAIANGLTMGDIHYDFIHGSITVADATVEEYAPTARGPREASAEAVVAEGDADLDGDDADGEDDQF